MNPSTTASDNFPDNRIHSCRLLFCISAWFLVLGLYTTLALTSNPQSYGSDLDAFLNARSALEIKAGRAYVPSRLPSYWLHEHLVSLFVNQRDARPVKVAGAVFVSLVLVLVALILRRERVPFVSGVVTVGALAVYPLFITLSFMAMDYALSLFFVLLTVLVFPRGGKGGEAGFMTFLAGCCCAAAIAGRLTNALLVPAVVLFLLCRKNRGSRRGMDFFLFLAGAGLSVLAYLPAYSLYGWDFLSAYNKFPGIYAIAKNNMCIFLYLSGGLAGAIGIACILSPFKSTVRRIVAALRLQERICVRLLLSFSIINTLFYLRYPDEPYYHLPLIVAAFIVSAIVSGRRLLLRRLFLFAVLFLSNFIIFMPSLKTGILAGKGALVGEVVRQNSQKEIFNGLAKLVDGSGEKSLLIGFSGTDKALVWFHDRAEVIDSFIHPWVFTVWGKKAPKVPDRIYRIGDCITVDPNIFDVGRGLQRLKELARNNGVKEVFFENGNGDPDVDLKEMEEALGLPVHGFPF